MKFTNGPSILPISAQVDPANLVPTINDRLRRLGTNISDLQATVASGLVGPAGPTGPTGATGPAGPALSNWIAYTPSVYAGGSMVISGYSTQVAEYQQSGNVCFIRVAVAAMSLGGSASNQLFISPPPIAPTDKWSTLACYLDDGGVYLAGFAFFPNLTSIEIQRYDGSLFTLSPSAALTVTGFYHC